VFSFPYYHSHSCYKIVVSLPAFPIVDELLLEQESPSLDALLSVDEQQLSSEKRIFCNGAVGCINRMRRRKEDVDDAPVLKKRPFCNGFFGCGNKYLNKVL
jgi:hypothetical protein